MNNFSTDRQDLAIWMLIGIVAFIACVMVYSRFAPPAPQQPAYYRPDPTPFVVETQHMDIFSHNQMCIGINVCN